jgi:meiotically up-regulated gene 157 (Mug157) protein
MSDCEHYNRTVTGVTADDTHFHYVYTCDGCGHQAFDDIPKAPELLGGAG